MPRLTAIEQRKTQRRVGDRPDQQTDSLVNAIVRCTQPNCPEQISLVKGVRLKGSKDGDCTRQLRRPAPPPADDNSRTLELDHRYCNRQGMRARRAASALLRRRVVGPGGTQHTTRRWDSSSNNGQRSEWPEWPSKSQSPISNLKQPERKKQRKKPARGARRAFNVPK